MEPINIPGRPSNLQWEYDEQADVLYLSLGEPRPAVGMDIGEGIIVRYDEANSEVLGLTLIGLRARVLKNLAGRA